MKCLNCSADVDEAEAMFVVKVLLCKVCGEAGQMLKDKALAGLENMMASMDDAVREALTNRTFPPIKKEMLESLSPEAVLHFLLAMRTLEPWNNQSLPSEITKPSALTAGGSESSVSPKAAG